MRRSHFSAWAPHCPVCARDRGLTPPLILTEGATERDDDVLSGTLVCADAACRHEYPIVDGIPIITPALRKLLGERAVELLLRDDLDPAALSLLGDALGPDSWLDVVRQGVSTYAWDAYADLDPAEGTAEPVPGAASRCLARLLMLAGPLRATERVLDLGCAAGRTTFDCAATGGALVLGIDSNLALLRLARGVATSGRVAYGRRRIGIVYDERRFDADLPGRERVDFWACDATALPFASESADMIVALNLLDCVADPVALLRAMMAALRPGGAMLLATPFDWSTRATPVTGWIGGHSQRGEGEGAAEPLLLALLTDGANPQSIAGLKITGICDQPWHTRLHDRSSVLYKTHLVALRRDDPRCLPAGQADRPVDILTMSETGDFAECRRSPAAPETRDDMPDEFPASTTG